jgi:hypothetical protein
MRINSETSNTSGAVLQGYVKTTLKKLIHRLGPPLQGVEDDMFCFWSLEDNKGIVATIYDWKLDNLPDDKKEYCWHIGGETQASLDLVADFLDVVVMLPFWNTEDC